MKEEIKEILDFKENADYKKLSVDEIVILKDYITNLKEELLQEKKDFKEANDYCFELKDYQQRNEKAIEYIKEHQRKDEFLNLNEWQTRDLLNILKGDDKE